MPAELAYDIEGTGTPVVFLHGLTFDRRMWRPITERLDGSVMTIAIDLPAHGESGGEPAPLEKVADQPHSGSSSPTARTTIAAAPDLTSAPEQERCRLVRSGPSGFEEHDPG